MTKKHRAKTGKNASHGNASKDVNAIVRALNAHPCVSTAIPGKIRPAKGGTSKPEVRFQRMDGKTKLKCVVRLRNVVQELVVITHSKKDVGEVQQFLETL